MNLLEKFFQGKPPVVRPPFEPSATSPIRADARHDAVDAGSRQSAALAGTLTLGMDVVVRATEPLQCDVAYIDGYLDAPINARKFSLARKGVMRGVAQVKEAEIRGDFDGELIVRGKLTVYPSARINGKVRFGEIVLWKGAQLTGDIKRMVKPGSSDRHAPRRKSPFEQSASLMRNTIGPSTVSH
jgi:cytoskeletal protein CcmA (bactofilin family)